jgi:hypothetical protein
MVAKETPTTMKCESIDNGLQLQQFITQASSSRVNQCMPKRFSLITAPSAWTTGCSNAFLCSLHSKHERSRLKKTEISRHAWCFFITAKPYKYVETWRLPAPGQHYSYLQAHASNSTASQNQIHDSNTVQLITVIHLRLTKFHELLVEHTYLT